MGVSCVASWRGEGPGEAALAGEGAGKIGGGTRELAACLTGMCCVGGKGEGEGEGRGGRRRRRGGLRGRGREGEGEKEGER